MKYSTKHQESRNRIIAHRVLTGDTLKSVGIVHGITPERVRQIVFKWFRNNEPDEYEIASKDGLKGLRLHYNFLT